MKKYVCVRKLELEKYDEDLYPIEGEGLIVEEGTEWEVDEESNYFLVAGSDAFRLINENGQWLEIYFDTLKEHFEEIA